MESNRSSKIRDCEVIEINDSVITLDDSFDDGASAGPTIISDVEDGEVTPDNEESNLVFTVQFKTESDFRSLHDIVQKALNDALASANIEVNVSNVDAGGNKLSLTAYHKSDEAEELEDFNIAELFQIDTEPAKKLDTELVPSYKRSVKKELNQDAQVPPKEIEDKCERPKNVSGCFNCGAAGHSVRECPKKPNSARIQRAKKLHCGKYERYHVDVEQRFAHIQPGVLSSETRAALGLKRGELPFMFYRMRVLGYPPAWLEAAQVVDSGIVLFNADGSEVLKSDEEENKNEGAKESVKFDVTKIVGFPGYNVHPGSRYYDDFRHHGVPAISDQQKKERLIEALGENVLKSYKRRKLKNLPATHDFEFDMTASVDLSTNDMEIEDSNDATATEVEFSRPRLPDDKPKDDTNKPLPPTTPPPQEEEGSTVRTRGESPTLEDLQAQQEQLLQQLESSSSLSKNTNVKNIELTRSLKRPAETCTTPDQSSPTKHFKTTHMGTPVLKFSEFDKLPDGENFKVGVSDVINFENLPDSTGKYEQMKDVIKNVRKTITKLQSEDD